jgi:hypothetical protein
VGGDNQLLGLVGAAVAGDQVDEVDRSPGCFVRESLMLDAPAVAFQFGDDEGARFFEFGGTGGARTEITLGLGMGEGFVAGELAPNLCGNRPGGGR